MFVIIGVIRGEIMIETKKSAYSLANLFVLDTEAGVVSKNVEQGHLKSLEMFHEVNKGDYLSRFWIVESPDYPTYSQTTLQTLFPSTVKKRLVVVSPNYKALYGKNTPLFVSGTIYDRSENRHLKAVTPLQFLLSAEELKLEYTLAEIRELALRINQRLQGPVDEEGIQRRDNAVKYAFDALLFMATSRSSGEDVEDAISTSMLDLHNLLEQKLEERGVPLERIHR